MTNMTTHNKMAVMTKPIGKKFKELWNIEVAKSSHRNIWMAESPCLLSHFVIFINTIFERF
jgi:hypothetical protein